MVRDYQTEPCGNLYGLCTERSLMLRAHGQDLDAQQDARAKAHNGWSSFIVQLPLVNSSRMATVRNLLRGSSADLWIIPFDDRPGKLFEGLQNCRSAVFVSVAGEDAGSHDLHSSKYQRWVTPVLVVRFSPNIELVKVEGALVSSRGVSEVCQTRRGSPVCTGHTATYAQLCGQYAIACVRTFCLLPGSYTVLGQSLCQPAILLEEQSRWCARSWAIFVCHESRACPITLCFAEQQSILSIFL